MHRLQPISLSGVVISFLVASSFTLPTSVRAESAYDTLRELAGLHASVKTFKTCQAACGRGSDARRCCICIGGDWFGSLKGGHCA